MITYKELIYESFPFPHLGFSEQKGELYQFDHNLMDLVRKQGAPLKYTFLPKIRQNIHAARQWFNAAINHLSYSGAYHYAYCTKSNHFAHVLHTVLEEKAQLETSSAYDIELIKQLAQKGNIDQGTLVIGNGFKTKEYKEALLNLFQSGFEHTIPVLDNVNELDFYQTHHQNKDNKLPLGIRVAAGEKPDSGFYTNRLGIPPQDILPFYRNQLLGEERFQLSMLHYFVHPGITDSSYYWKELDAFCEIYCKLQPLCPGLRYLNIGGGLPIPQSLDFTLDYQGLIEKVIKRIKSVMDVRRVPHPDIVTEFGSFTVGESGGSLYQVLDTKTQNDQETWYMLDSSLITTLPDIWGINKKFILLALNHWDKPMKRVNLGGLTCDNLDYYNAESHIGEVYLPEINKGEELYVGFFHTGAYQESLGGFGGIQHCLIPAPQQVVVDTDTKNLDGSWQVHPFSKKQDSQSMLKTLGF